MTRYDEIDYGGHAHGFTAPNRLAGLARIFGCEAPSPGHARTLELGCGGGRNLVPLAAFWPDATFLGVDLAGLPIGQATDLARAAGAANVRFLQADVAELSAEALGSFEFVIAHGLFTWVPAAVRDAVLRLISRVLSPTGVAMVSFNAYPGAHMRLLVRELVHLMVGPVADGAGIGPAWRFLERMQNAVPDDAPPFLRGVLQEVAAATSLGPAQLFHDDLAPDHQVFYLTEFAAMAAGQGLTCLCDARVDSMFEPDEAPATTRWLDEASGGDWLRRMQLVDFVHGTRFKRLLLCRQAAARAAGPQRAALARAHWMTDLVPDGPVETTTSSPARFQAEGRVAATLTHPLVKATLLRFQDSPTRTVATADVAAMVRDGGGPKGEDPMAVATRVMHQLMRLGSVFAVAEPIPAVGTAAGERPRLRALTRALLDLDLPWTDNQHVSSWQRVPWHRELARALDGRRTAEELVGFVPPDGAAPADAVRALLVSWSRRGLLA